MNQFCPKCFSKFVGFEPTRKTCDQCARVPLVSDEEMERISALREERLDKWWEEKLEAQRAEEEYWLRCDEESYK